MGFHHVALATRDMARTHRFYTEMMGFELVKAVVAPTPGARGGWAKHVFYATGTSPSGEQGMIAFWELHDDEIGDDFVVDRNSAAGLPWWVDHVAFDAPTREDLDRHRERWQAAGETVVEVDHGFCASIYLRDPDGNTVEFCHTVRSFTDAERAHAAAAVTSPAPALDGEEARITVHRPVVAPRTS